MTLLAAVVGALLAGAATLSLILPARHRTWWTMYPAAAGLAACTVGAAGAARVLWTNADVAVTAAWSAPGGSFAIHVDALSALFLLPIFVLGGLGTVYGRGYWALPSGGQPRTAWAWYFVFVAAMALVVVAANAVLFLVAWEAMSIAAFFLVTYEDDRPEVRQAGWTFLIAAHLGTAFLFAMFALLGRGAESLDFAALNGAAGSGAAAGAVFLLALIGFGTKAGLVPAHVWLPAAHPAAPSHVSAVLSGAMLKTGIYGLLRVLTLLPVIPPWGGWLLIAVGLVSGLFGIIFALAQRDLKRLLADSSIENLGVITLGIGIGVVGMEHGSPALVVLGFSGALLHALNHALFKGLLFLVAGAVLHATGTRDLEELGGLLRRMPRTGVLFFVGAAAIAALPPLNGFVGEFLLYLAAFEGLRAGDGAVVVAMIAVILGLALIGGLVAATFLKAALAFAGQPRGGRAAAAHDPGATMLWPMAALALGCVAIGLVPAAALRLIRAAVGEVGRVDAAAVSDQLALADTLMRVTLVAAVLTLTTLALWLLRARLLAGREVARRDVWATAYLATTPRQQYTGASFAQPLASLFGDVLRPLQQGGPPAGYFPAEATFARETPGLFRERVFVPAFRGVTWAALRMRWLQHGRIQLYLVNIAVTLVVLLVWKLGGIP